jgi:hypothetical protein
MPSERPEIDHEGAAIPAAVLRGSRRKKKPLFLAAVLFFLILAAVLAISLFNRTPCLTGGDLTAWQVARDCASANTQPQFSMAKPLKRLCERTKSGGYIFTFGIRCDGQLITPPHYRSIVKIYVYVVDYPLLRAQILSSTPCSDEEFDKTFESP